MNGPKGQWHLDDEVSDAIRTMQIATGEIEETFADKEKKTSMSKNPCDFVQSRLGKRVLVGESTSAKRESYHGSITYLTETPVVYNVSESVSAG